MRINLELYEALKPHVGEDAAKMMAEVVPPARDLVTKSDMAELQTAFEAVRADFGELRGDVIGRVEGLRGEFGELRGEFGELRADVVGRVEGLRGDIKALEARMFRWMLGLFVPMWATTLVALIVVIARV